MHVVSAATCSAGQSPRYAPDAAGGNLSTGMAASASAVGRLLGSRVRHDLMRARKGFERSSLKAECAPARIRRKSSGPEAPEKQTCERGEGCEWRVRVELMARGAREADL